MKDESFRLLRIMGLLVPISCFMFYLIAFYPGIMTPDSIDQWAQIISLDFYDWHPVMHTLFMYLCTRIWYSPASVAIAQIVILTVVFLSGIKVLHLIGVNKLILGISILLFALYPTNGFMAVTLWKDILYSIMLLWLTVLLMNIVLTEGHWISSTKNQLLFSISSLGILFFRHNGILTFIFVILTLIVMFSKYFKYWSILAVAVLTVYFIVTGPVYKAMNVLEGPSTEAMGIPMQQIAAVIKSDGKLTDEQKDFFGRILPIEVWKEKYHPYITNPLKFDDSFNSDFLVENKVQFAKHWLAVIKQNPVITAKAYLKQTSMIWKISPLNGSFTYTVSPGIIENNLGLHEITVSSSITNYAGSILEYTSNEPQLLIFWRPALWLYLSLAAGIIIALRTSWRALSILGPMISNTMAFLIATPSQDYRYQYVNVLIAAILIPWAIHSLYKKSFY